MRSKASAPYRKNFNRQSLCAQVQQGMSLIELTAAVTIASLLIAGLGGVVVTALKAERVVHSNNNLQQQARFAMQQMVKAVSRSERLILPLPENTNTVWSESVRDPGVLAVTLASDLDRNNDGWADGNNDKDYLDLNNNDSRDSNEPELIDEDTGDDSSNDSASGIVNIDDNGDGIIDNGLNSKDDDEDGDFDEDIANGLDDDNDGAIDEDLSDDNSADNKAGVIDVDDDDEDGSNDEDWLDAVVFYQSGSTLIQRIPNIDPVDGNDYSEYTLADNVSEFRVERIFQASARAVLVDLILTLSNADGESSRVTTRIRVGGSL
ncbi:MAG: prepilin-type N-terminal cleavage/methylation domain-containing protein [Gammaproteobacteria bacterium]|nr:prepilin-type N-terminal cleavage/methylation domain-containing protein [Gammaproteobacteria bacterium]